jgi:hypothetical protein
MTEAALEITNVADFDMNLVESVLILKCDEACHEPSGFHGCQRVLAQALVWSNDAVLASLA